MGRQRRRRGPTHGIANLADEIVPDDHIVALQPRHEELLDIGFEALPLIGPSARKRIDPIVPEGYEEGARPGGHRQTDSDQIGLIILEAVLRSGLERPTGQRGLVWFLMPMVTKKDIWSKCLNVRLRRPRASLVLHKSLSITSSHG